VLLPHLRQPFRLGGLHRFPLAYLGRHGGREDRGRRR
jgi:hypothetical protein